MTPAEFKRKWSRFAGKESSAYQEHFNDLCHLLGQKSPAEADPTGSDFFCFQKCVVKDAELLEGASEKVGVERERGFADVWKKGHFAWEYKGKRKDLGDAYKQLLRYRESLLNPPLLVVCDFEDYIVRTNFNGTVQEIHAFSNGEIDSPENWRVLRSLFLEPESLKPKRTTAEVTETLAAQIADVARSLQKRESVEYADARTRKAVNFAQRRNLRIARFLNRIVFCFFAEDSGLLPPHLFSEITKTALEDPKQFASALEELFRVMAKGGMYGHHKIRHFNGHLFEEATVFELNEEELDILARAAEADWNYIQPSIMGTLFERALEPEQRSQLGAHYTSENDIRTLVEPVLMAPLQREWATLKGALAPAIKKGRCSKEQRETISSFLKRLSAISVLDPACGSGNFLYVSLQLLLDLEKEVVAFATMLELDFKLKVSVQQLKAIEINPYAYELAQVSVQIGFLQWRRDNGFDNDRTPVLQVLDGFENKDALMHETFRKKPKNLKKAREEEHQMQDELFKVYVERAWPECTVIVGNPPFLGGKMLRRELGDAYVDALFENFGTRVSPEADLCCYWFEKARQQIQDGHCDRAGLLATQGIRGGANRSVLKNIKQSGDIFFAISDREWVLAGANVHVSMVAFDGGKETHRLLDGREVPSIHANLAASSADVTTAKPLKGNSGIAYMGDTKGGSFDLTEAQAMAMLIEPNPHGYPNSDVIVPWVNGLDVTRRPRGMFIINFGSPLNEEDCAKYQSPFGFVSQHVRPERLKNNRALYAKYWWRHVEPRPGMLASLENLPRFLATARVAKHRLFDWLEAPTLPDSQVFAFARSDDFAFGILHSRLHETWARANGTQVRERESGFRYTPTSCFETFPFPKPTPQLEDRIASAAKELSELRDRWLNPPEWTSERILAFPGTKGGPWDRYIGVNTVDAKTNVGTVRYPQREPKDAACATKLTKRTLTNLYNERPAWLDLAHKKLDIAVAAAYGWPEDLSEEVILEKLLALNVERAAEELKLGKPNKVKSSRGKREDEML